MDLTRTKRKSPGQTAAPITGVHCDPGPILQVHWGGGRSSHLSAPGISAGRAEAAQRQAGRAETHFAWLSPRSPSRLAAASSVAEAEVVKFCVGWLTSTLRKDSSSLRLPCSPMGKVALPQLPLNLWAIRQSRRETLLWVWG